MRRSCRPTRSVRCRRTVRTWPSASTRIEATRANQRAVEAAGEFVREHHSWRRRGEQVFNHLANGAPIDLRSVHNEPQLGRAVTRVGLSQDLPLELKTTKRFG